MRQILQLICAVMVLASGPALADTKEVTADIVFQDIKDGKVILIDVRRPVEWKQTGVPKGALAITMHRPISDFLADVSKAVGGRKDAPVALICAAGNRSTWMQKVLKDNGFTDVRNVGEGLFGNGENIGWLRRGLPVVPCKDCE